VHLRLLLPLLGAAALLGPIAAAAAPPVPDTPPPGPALEPDPAPAATPAAFGHALAPHARVEAIGSAVAVVRQSPVVSVPTQPVLRSRPRPTPKPAPKRARHAVEPSAPIADVLPRAVDVPVGLGSLGAPLRDEGTALLAALALLAAAVAAASGAALTVVWHRAGAAA
jgi:hypothetical protein